LCGVLTQHWNVTYLSKSKSTKQLEQVSSNLSRVVASTIMAGQIKLEVWNPDLPIMSDLRYVSVQLKYSKIQLKEIIPVGEQALWYGNLHNFLAQPNSPFPCVCLLYFP